MASERFLVHLENLKNHRFLVTFDTFWQLYIFGHFGHIFDHFILFILVNSTNSFWTWFFRDFHFGRPNLSFWFPKVDIFNFSTTKIFKSNIFSSLDKIFSDFQLFKSSFYVFPTLKTPKSLFKNWNHDKNNVTTNFFRHFSIIFTIFVIFFISFIMYYLGYL